MRLRSSFTRAFSTFSPCLVALMCGAELRIWQDFQLVGSACGGALLPVPIVRCPLFGSPMTPDLPFAYAYGDNRRTTQGLTRDHCPLPTLRTFVSLLPLVALTFPPTPFLSRTAGEEGGMLPPHLPSGLLPLLHGERKGGMLPPHLPSGPLPLLHGERKG
jgi:hypothetical protein